MPVCGDQHRLISNCEITKQLTLPMAERTRGLSRVRLPPFRHALQIVAEATKLKLWIYAEISSALVSIIRMPTSRANKNVDPFCFSIESKVGKHDSPKVQRESVWFGLQIIPLPRCGKNTAGHGWLSIQARIQEILNSCNFLLPQLQASIMGARFPTSKPGVYQNLRIRSKLE